MILLRIKNVAVVQLPLFFWLVFQHNRCVIAANMLSLQPDAGSFQISLLSNQ